MHHLGEVVQCAACAVRTYSVYEPETLFFINMTEERLQSCMCQVRGMMVTVLGMVTVCGLEEWSRCVLEVGLWQRCYSAVVALRAGWEPRRLGV